MNYLPGTSPLFVYIKPSLIKKVTVKDCKNRGYLFYS
jgi:hypothetical protein